MPVSKRTRYEVLRRDNFTCRYCRSTESELTVDHVVPTALGGSDDPANLVAACKDCNAGKASVGPDAETVADVKADELRWAAALAKAAEIDAERAKGTAALVEWFDDTWYDLMPPWAVLPNSVEVRATVLRFTSLGLSRTTLEECISIAAGKGHVAQRQRWNYFCGICWNKVREFQDAAREILAAEEIDS